MDDLLKVLAIRIIKKSLGNSILVKGIALTPQELVDRAWRESGGPPQKLEALMEEYALPEIKGRLLLTIESLELLWDKEYANDFFIMLKGWASLFKMEPWSKLSLVVEISTAPALMAPQANAFNVAPAIKVD